MEFTNIKNLYIGEIALAPAVVYTAPAVAGNQAQLTQCDIHNTGALASTVTVYHGNGSDVQRFSVTLAAGDTLTLFTQLQLNAGQSLKAVSQYAGVNIFIEGREFI
jgi:hypothetical protein